MPTPTNGGRSVSAISSKSAGARRGMLARTDAKTLKARLVHIRRA